MKYFRISNRGSLNRKFIELIGLSTKRDGAKAKKVIGFKGSGTKLAAVAALRMDMHTGISSQDAEGRYYLTFKANDYEVDGAKVRQVHYVYYRPAEGGSEISRDFPSNLVVDAFADWDQPIGDDDKKSFKIVREHVCNAYDEDRKFSYGPAEKNYFAAEGETSVYLAYTDEIKAIFARPERYFKFCAKQKPVVAVEGHGEIYPKSEKQKTRLFLMGVLVDCTAKNDLKSLFDYSLEDKSLLSEERILKNAYEYILATTKMFGQLTNRSLARTILQAAADGTAKYETEVLQRMSTGYLSEESKKSWLAAIRDVFGKRIALPSNDGPVNSDVEQMYGFKVVHVGEGLTRFLATMGVPKADDIFPRDPEKGLEYVAFDELSKESRERFTVAYSLFARHFPDQAAIPIFFYHPLSEAVRKMSGFAGHGNNVFERIGVATKTRDTLPVMTELLHTLIHEARHCVTKAYDNDRRFCGRADLDIVMMVLREAGYRQTENGTAVPQTADPSVFLPNFLDIDDLRAQQASNAPPSESADTEVDIDFAELDIALDELLDTVREDDKK